MSRRLLLGLCVLAVCAVLAGCSAPGSLTLSAVNDTELGENATRSISPGSTNENTFTRIVTGAVENGSVTATSAYDPPVDPDGLPVAVDGRVYELTATPISNETHTRASIEIDYNASDTTGITAAYDTLSAADQRVLQPLLPPQTDRRVPGPDFGAGDRYTPAERNASVLLSSHPEIIVYDGERYPITIETRPAAVTTYEYTATELAQNYTTYGQQLREEYAITLRGLSDGERTLLDEARTGGYYAESTDDAAFNSLRTRLRSQPAVTEDASHGRWVVRYKGTIYWAVLHDDGFA